MNLNTIYLICTIGGGTILILRFILAVVGLDSGDADIPNDSAMDALSGDHAGGFNLLSLQSIAGFFTMFGLVGMGLLQIKASDFLSILGALFAGGFTAWATGMIFLGMRRLQSEGTMDIQNAVGQTGTVYLTIPETGTGVVTVTVQGGLRNLDAVSENRQPIPTGKIVKVVGITAGKILVVAETTTDIH
ncbi:MAG: hypothetical protein IH586_14275 [Anaerolineaceae bacterium]|nr:hypothetical protein [Anaerolineaceae bacterium]